MSLVEHQRESSGLIAFLLSLAAQGVVGILVLAVIAVVPALIAVIPAVMLGDALFGGSGVGEVLLWVVFFVGFPWFILWALAKQ